MKRTKRTNAPIKADDTIFRRLAQGRRGGYLRVAVDEREDAHVVGAGRAAAVADCALALHRGERCEPHPDIEESYRAVDMAVAVG